MSYGPLSGSKNDSVAGISKNVQLLALIIRWLVTYLLGGPQIAQRDPACVLREGGRGSWSHRDLSCDGWLNVPVALERLLDRYVCRRAMARATVGVGISPGHRRQVGSAVSLLRLSSGAATASWDPPRRVSGWN